jgi:hypothetical protein
MQENDGIIPSNIGLDGTIGGEVGGKWYGGVYCWGFSVVVPQTGELAHRPRIRGGLPGFGNAYLLTGDRRYVDAWTNMIDVVNSNARMIDGEKMYPHMHGDDGWYDFHNTPWDEGALECWFWTCAAQDRRRVADHPWVQFLAGENPGYPERALRADFENIRSCVAGMRADTTTPDTRLADDPMRFNPATVETLRQLMLGGLDPGRNAAPLHCRLRYFDPAQRRAGIPDDVAALVDSLTDDRVSVTLVNVNQIEAREMIVQCGAYAEHQCIGVELGDERVDVDAPSFTVRLAPGAGQRLVIHTRRYANQPTLAFPWNRDPG